MTRGAGIDDARAWQVGIWDQISQLYWAEIDSRFAPVVEGLLRRAAVRQGERVLDLGTGTGAAAAKAADAVGARGQVLGIDPSPEMVGLASRRARESDVGFEVALGTAEEIPAADEAFDAIIASLSLMYVIDRDAAAREITRVLRKGGRLVAAVWAAPEACDIVRFQQTAGGFAPPPPVPGVGPGALADTHELLDQLARAGVEARVETEELGFDFDSFESAWDVLAGVTTAGLSPERRDEARAAVQADMWQNPQEPRRFRNTTQFITGTRV